VIGSFIIGSGKVKIILRGPVAGSNGKIHRRQALMRGAGRTQHPLAARSIATPSPGSLGFPRRCVGRLIPMSCSSGGPHNARLQ
jgi:hypothetical protein